MSWRVSWKNKESGSSKMQSEQVAGKVTWTNGWNLAIQNRCMLLFGMDPQHFLQHIKPQVGTCTLFSSVKETRRATLTHTNEIHMMHMTLSMRPHFFFLQPLENQKDGNGTHPGPMSKRTSQQLVATLDNPKI